MASGEPARDLLVADLTADLGVVLGTPVAPADLVRRRDGAAPALLGMLTTASARSRSTACRLLTEWISSGSVEPVEEAETWSPLALHVPGLGVDGVTAFPGVNLRGVPAGTAVVEKLALLVEGAAVLVGGLPEVVVVDGGRLEELPGWVMRLRLLARRDEVGPAPDPSGDVGGWAVAAHEAVACVHVPAAADDSLWATLLGTLRTAAGQVLKEVGEAAGGDLLRRGSAGFDDLVDMQASPALEQHTPRDGQVVQVVRLPRRHKDQIRRGAVLFAPAS